MSLFTQKKKEEKVPAAPTVKTDKIAERFALGMTSVGDIVAPSYVEVDFSHIMVDKHYYTTLFVVGYPRYVGPNWLNPLITFDHPLYISMYIYCY